MQSFTELLSQFETFFSKHQFPNQPHNLYAPCTYLLGIGGKRIRPVACLMTHELFAPLSDDAWNLATALELFHNFTLMHDDIMDQAPLRRGFTTVHEKWNVPTAILSGDVMSIFAYVHLNKINTHQIHDVMALFNQTAIQICEGQQLDMDFEQKEFVSIHEYVHMITLKTSVLLAASMKFGGMLGGATSGCSDLLYELGKSIGIAFQLKDDFLDAYGDSAKTGKQIGGDIIANKKTFLLAKANEIADETQRIYLRQLLARHDEMKINDMLTFFDSMNIKTMIQQEIETHATHAYALLDKLPVMEKQKIHIRNLVDMLLMREN
jgi:geranylgeranyl diphosphate synthase, type II